MKESQPVLSTSQQFIECFGINTSLNKNVIKIMDVLMFYVSKHDYLTQVVSDIETFTNLKCNSSNEEINLINSAAKNPELIILADDFSACSLWLALLADIKMCDTLTVVELSISKLSQILDVEGLSRQSLYAKLKKSIEKINTVTHTAQLSYTLDMINEKAFIAISTSKDPVVVKEYLIAQSTADKNYQNYSLLDAICK